MQIHNLSITGEILIVLNKPHLQLVVSNSRLPSVVRLCQFGFLITLIYLTKCLQAEEINQSTQQFKILCLS